MQARRQSLRSQAAGVRQQGRLVQRFAQGEKVTGTRAADHDLGKQSLYIQHGSELFAQFGAQDCFAHQIADGIETGFDFRQFQRGSQQAMTEQAAAHAGAGLVQNADERGPAIGEDGFEEFEVAHGYGIEHHGVCAVEVARRIKMIERGALGIAQVVQHSAGGRDGLGFPGETKAIERQQFEMFAQDAVRVIAGENPVFLFGDDEALRLGVGKQGCFGGHE